MSIILGLINSDDRPVEKEQLTLLGYCTSRYASGEVLVRCDGGVGMSLQPYHTHERS